MKKPKELHVDIETYSSEDIKKSGAYRYIESPDFEILLVAFAFDDGPVHIVDLALGEELPEEFIEYLLDEDVEKHAHNAVFERLSFNRWGYKTPISSWHCSAIKALYCGYPMSLADVSKAMNLADKAKDSAGKRLIAYFCVPCKPTKVNKGRTRNLPEHDMEKWEMFKSYCKQDVVAERAIERRLSDYRISPIERKNYVIDQRINDRGIEVDLNLARAAIKINEDNSAALLKTMKDITGLQNPTSQKQLTGWLSYVLRTEVTSVAKDNILSLIEYIEGPRVGTNEWSKDEVKEVLKLKLALSKTSIKKYIAMLNCVCSDGRIHGLFQYYGANRTGRWAGRLVQLQNLPQNHIDDLEGARDLALTGDVEILEMVYPEIGSTLSQLIRTAFVAPQGMTFGVADYSAIEARVIAWLAGEQWRLDVFNTHGKIYESSASMMFNVPQDLIVKGNPEYALRQKGKIAELALGYGGSVGALEQMGGAKMGLKKSEMKDIVTRWRTASPAIVALWWALDGAAKKAIKTKRLVVLEKYKNISFYFDGKALICTLPSGRQLFYVEAGLTTNRFGGESIKYKGMDQVKKVWTWLETYGGKITENVIQAIARDLLAAALYNLDQAGFPVVMHVHDEDVAEISRINTEKSLSDMYKLMCKAPAWAAGLPLKAAGYITPFYKKD